MLSCRRFYGTLLLCLFSLSLTKVLCTPITSFSTYNELCNENPSKTQVFPTFLCAMEYHTLVLLFSLQFFVGHKSLRYNAVPVYPRTGGVLVEKTRFMVPTVVRHTDCQLDNDRQVLSAWLRRVSFFCLKNNMCNVCDTGNYSF